MKIGTMILSIFLTLFGLVFVLAGSAVVLMGFTTQDGAEEAPWYVFVPFGLVFVGAGSAVIWKAWRLPGEQERIEQEKETYAAEPWKRVKEWRTNRIGENSRGGVWFFWIFAIFWNSITAAVIGMSWEEMLRQAQDEPGIYAILIFPLVGIGLLIAAVRGTIRARTFPPSFLTLDTMPVPIGGALEGTLQVPYSLRDAGSIRIRLTCYRITRSGKNTHSTPVWQDEQDLPGMQVTTDGRHGLLPVRIVIPHDAPGSTIDYGPRISWQMDLSADVPGVDYYASFAVPVFGSPGGGEMTDERLSIHTSVAPRSETDHGTSRPRTVPMSMSADGGMLWDFGPARVPGPAAGITVFAILWGAVTAFLWMTDDVPLMITVVFSVFELLMLWGVYDMWFTRITVTIRDGTLTRRSGPIVTIRYVQVPRDDIGDFTIRSGMSAGSTAYHDITLVRKNGKRLRVGPYLRSVREAKAIVKEMRNTLGMEGGRSR